MKATVSGVQVEGTPQEIAEYVRLVKPVSSSVTSQTYKPDSGTLPPMMLFDSVSSASATVKI